MTTPATYDFPWGTRPICPRTHEATIGGDGYGDRCCGTADVETVEESSPDCPRFYCERCCDDRCCRACHEHDVEGDALYCVPCDTGAVYQRPEEQP